MSAITRILDKSGAAGAIVGSFSCAMCFPAAASLGAAIGLDFLSHWEGLSVHWLIGVLGLTHGFVCVGMDLARGTFYTGLIIMFLTSIWDMVNPANRRCATDGCKTSTPRS